MNILREFRRVKKRSVQARILLISIFSVILIINTYAWFSANEPVNMNGLEADVTPWDVRYYVDDKGYKRYGVIPKNNQYRTNPDFRPISDYSMNRTSDPRRR